MTDFLNKIRSYLLDWRTDDYPQLPKDLRTLPAKRAHTLTPSPSQASLIFSSASGSPFFERLPAEIRNQIYMVAFGNRTIHIDLQRNLSEFPFDPSISFHAGSERRLRCSEHPGWCWWSSVCHRAPPFDFFYDDCRNGGREFADCELYASDLPQQCFLGVMGWLLACRRAYTETINLIYRTNTIHLNSVFIVHFAPRLLLSDRLSQITSLEIVLPLQLAAPLNQNLPDRAKIQWSIYKSITVSLPSNFPSLQKLHLSVSTNCRFQFSNPSLEGYEEHLLELLDALLRRSNPTLRELTLAVPQPLHEALMSQAVKTGTTVSEQIHVNGEYSWWRFWRTVDNIDGSDRRSGYWIRQGTEDVLVRKMFEKRRHGVDMVM